MEATLISHADGREFIRMGECDGCKRHGVTQAQCCTFLAMPTARRLTQDEAHWAELHPGILVQDNHMVVNVACSALTADGLCSLFGSPERPAMCERFPELPEQVPVGCAYTFSAPMGAKGLLP
jgi:hypothetical protein